MKRNQSIIVDLMYGQFKSIVQCPREHCKYISITFDPFSVCSLPLIDNSRKTMELIWLKNHIYSKKLKYSFTTEKDYTLQDKIVELNELIGAAPDARLIMYVASYSSC